MPKKIAVIGAGVAGAACAQQLTRTYKCSVKLFDKSRGVGGRVATRRETTDGGVCYQCDHGAQYFTARSCAFRKQVQEWKSLNVADIWTSKPWVYDGQKWTSSINSDVERWCGIPSMNNIVRHMLQDQELVLNSTINEISKTTEGKWNLHSLEGGLFDEGYDVVVIAVPAAQCIPLIQPHSCKLLDVSQEAVMKGTWALTLFYESPKHVKVPFDCAFINDDGPISWISRDSSKPMRDQRHDIWVIHAKASWSHDNIQRSPDDVAGELEHAFCSLKVPGDYQVPPPTSRIIHRWLFATTHPNLDVGYIWDEINQIGVCGDWLNVGKVEGAWLSGVELAHTILR